MAKAEKTGAGVYRERHSFAKIPGIVDVPNLIAIQTDSFKWFMEEGITEAFNDVCPIENSTKDMCVELGEHHFGEPKYTVDECKEKDVSYQAPLYAKIRFINRETGEIKDQNDLFMGDFPLMTPRGTFIINGTERVVVSQLVRSPGIYFSAERDKTSDKTIYGAKVIPSRGAWLEFETDKRDILSVRIDRKRKQPATLLVRALGLAETREEIIELLGNDEMVLRTLDRDPATTKEESLIELYKRFRPGEPPTVGSKAFYNCKKLAGELALPSSLKGVNESAFAGGTRDDVSLAPKLTSLLGLENTKLATVGVAAFKGNMIGGALTFPVTLDSVGASAFQNNLITKVSFLNTTVDKIVLGSSCFQNNKIKTNPLTQGVRFGMADYAFADNSLTGEFSFEDENVPAPARGVISGNPGVTKVTISKFWGFIPGDAFKGLADEARVHVLRLPVHFVQQPVLHILPGHALQPFRGYHTNVAFHPFTPIHPKRSRNSHSPTEGT